jgi:hypothetical protein
MDDEKQQFKKTKVCCLQELPHPFSPLKAVPPELCMSRAAGVFLVTNGVEDRWGGAKFDFEGVYRVGNLLTRNYEHVMAHLATLLERLLINNPGRPVKVANLGPKPHTLFCLFHMTSCTPKV